MKTAVAARDAAAADVPSLDEVFRRYASYVAAIGIQILGRDVEVDDLVQDVFVEAHRGLHKLRDPAALKAWLAKVTVRAARRRLKKRRLRRFFSLDEAPAGELRDAAVSPDEQAEMAAVYRALDDLPADDRIVWVLRHVQGEKLDDIVAMTGKSLSTVQRKLRSAETTLRQTLGGGDE